MKVVYKITYPNGKIYVGQDLTGAASLLRQRDRRLVQTNWPPGAVPRCTVRKEILWEWEAHITRR